MKKLLAIILSVMLATVSLVFVGCGDNGGGGTVGGDEKVTFKDAKAYSIDLTDIDGYTLKVTNGTWAETYDACISLLKKETDPAKRYAVMHKAENLLMSTNCLIPIYYYTDLYMKNKDLNGFYSSPLGYKYFMDCDFNGDASILDVCLASDPTTIDPALNSTVDGATIITHCFSGLIKWGLDSTGKLVLQPDCATAIPTPVTLPDGKVSYTFTLKEGLKWSNGTELKASDFVKSWNRAIAPATASDYNYMFDIVDGYSEGTLNATADDTARTVEIVIINACPYFIELCAFPTYMPVPASADANGTWATNKDTYICNGPYTITDWQSHGSITFEPNANYHGTAPKLQKLVMHLTDDNNLMLTNYKKGDWKFIDDVPVAEIDNLKARPEKDFYCPGQLGTYYVVMNNNSNLLPASYCEGKTDEQIVAAMNEVRLALALIIDRDYICKSIAQGGQVPASSFVSMGLTEDDGSEFYMKSGNSEEYDGFYNVDSSESVYSANCAQAIQILKKYYEFNGNKATNFPSFDYITNPSSGHVAIAQYLQALFMGYGINMNVDLQEWAVFTETRKAGDYTAARNGWLCDYNDPVSMLDMWITESGNNDAQFGK